MGSFRHIATTSLCCLALLMGVADGFAGTSVPWLQRILQRPKTHVSLWQSVRATAQEHEIFTPEQQMIHSLLRQEAEERHAREQVSAPVVQLPVPGATAPTIVVSAPPPNGSPVAIAPRMLPAAGPPVQDPLGLAGVRENVVPITTDAKARKLANAGASPSAANDGVDPKLTAKGSVAERTNTGTAAATTLPTRRVATEPSVPATSSDVTAAAPQEFASETYASESGGQRADARAPLQQGTPGTVTSAPVVVSRIPAGAPITQPASRIAAPIRPIGVPTSPARVETEQPRAGGEPLPPVRAASPENIGDLAVPRESEPLERRGADAAPVPAPAEQRTCRSEIFDCDRLTTWSIGMALAAVTRVRRTNYTVALLPIRDDARAMILDPYGQTVVLCTITDEDVDGDLDELISRGTSLTSRLSSLEVVGDCPSIVHRAFQRALASEEAAQAESERIAAADERILFRARLNEREEIGLDRDGNILRLEAEPVSRVGRLPFTPKLGHLSYDRSLLFAASDTELAFIDTDPYTLLSSEYLHISYERPELQAIIDLPSDEAGSGLMLVHQVGDQSVITWLPRRASPVR